MIKLKQHQSDAVNWLKEHKRCLFTDATGLGKTYSAIFAMELPCVVVCPAGLAFNWQQELTACGHICLNTTQFTAENKLKIFDMKLDELVIIISYAQAQRLSKKHITKLRRAKTVIIDEAHNLKSRNSKRRIAVKQLAKRAKQVFLLTATPLISDCGDYWSYLNMINSSKFSSYWQFTRDYCHMDYSPWNKKAGGIKSVDKFAHDHREYIFGRTYEEVDIDIPDLYERTVELNLTPQTKSIYNDFVRDWFTEQENLEGWENVDVASAIKLQHTLRQLCSTDQNKINTLLELLDDRKTIIWCVYQNTVEKLQAVLGDNAVSVYGKNVKDKNKTLAKFKNGKRYLIGTYKTLGEGLNLQFSDTSVAFESNWTPLSKIQAIGRQRRIGSMFDTVFAYNLVTKNTIEEQILEAQEGREYTATQILAKIAEQYGYK